MRKASTKFKRKPPIKKTGKLEKVYLQYLTPMSLDEWNNVKSLEQPNLLKEILTKTSHSSRD